MTWQPSINSAISEIVRTMAPDIEHIRYEIGEDWSGDPAVFFRVLLSDEASRTRLIEVAKKVVAELRAKLDFDSMGLFAYYNFRSVSEQAVLQEPILGVADGFSRGPASTGLRSRPQGSGQS